MSELEQYQTAGGPIFGSTAREIASSVETAIRERLLDAGETLPTVRALAATLGTSPATVNSAYGLVRQRGLIVTGGRRGTRVAPRPALRSPERGRPSTPANQVRDLSIGLPDPALVPPIAPALQRIDLERTLRISALDRPDPELHTLAVEAFAQDGLPADAVSVFSGAFDAIERVLQAHLRPGDRVIIEDPAYVSIRDLLLALGLVALPVPVDEFGLLPEQLEATLIKGAEAIVVVPRAQNPLGAAFDTARAADLTEILDRHPDVLLIEDDHAGGVSGAPFSTLVDNARARWAVVRSMSKVLHPDVRVALMTGDDVTIARVEGRQSLGPRWVSHVMQALVAELLRDPGFEPIVNRARHVYTARRRALLDALAERGVAAHGRSGLNVWVPLREEAPVLRALGEAGWLAAAGERFRIDTGPGVRITVATLDEREAQEVAEIVAAAEHAGRPRPTY